MSEYILSFCIPVYNHASMTCRIVTNILQCKDKRIQVVVSDDGSTDNTVDRLREINDERLKIVSSSCNSGAQRNWYRTLMQGDGKWLYLLIGRDTINPYNISALLKLLETLEKKNVGFVRENRSLKKGVRVYSSVESLKVLLDFAHPTGSIFLRAAFHTPPDKMHYYEIADVYPENYVKRDIIRNYLCAETAPLIFTGKTIVPLKTVRSLYEQKQKPDFPFYHPKRSTGQVLEIIDMIEEPDMFQLSQDVLDDLFLYKWKFLLYNITFYQRIRFLSPGFLGHYGEKRRKVGRIEMIKNMIIAYRDVSAHFDHISPSRRKKMIMALLKQAVQILSWSDSKILNSKWSGIGSKTMIMKGTV